MSAACAPGEYEHGITGHGYHSGPVPGCRQLESPFVSAGEMTGGRDDVAERELAAGRPLLTACAAFAGQALARQALTAQPGTDGHFSGPPASSGWLPGQPRTGRHPATWTLATGQARETDRRGHEGAEAQRAAHGGEQVALLGPLDPVRDHRDSQVPAHPDQRLDQDLGRGFHAQARDQVRAYPDQVDWLLAEPGQPAVPGRGDIHGQPDPPLTQLTEPAQDGLATLTQYRGGDLQDERVRGEPADLERAQDGVGERSHQLAGQTA